MSNFPLVFKGELIKLLIIATGAIPGAWIRWHVNNNLVVNLIGSIFMGFIWASVRSSKVKLLLAVGFCGSLTTFSGWIFKSLHLFINGSYYESIWLIIKTLFLSIFGAALSFVIAKRFMLPMLFQLHSAVQRYLAPHRL